MEITSKNNKFYVVFNGVQPGVYLNWESCSQQVVGFSGSVFRSFNTLDEAICAYQSYINGANDAAITPKRRYVSDDGGSSSSAANIHAFVGCKPVAARNLINASFPNFLLAMIFFIGFIAGMWVAHKL